MSKWHIMTRMVGPDCALMRNSLNTHTRTVCVRATSAAKHVLLPSLPPDVGTRWSVSPTCAHPSDGELRACVCVCI